MQREEQPVVVTSVTSTALYEENMRPCFVWTLILAPCLMPTVWYVEQSFHRLSRCDLMPFSPGTTTYESLRVPFPLVTVRGVCRTRWTDR